MDEIRDFKGVWIPKEIWLCKDLTAIDKVLLAEINSLDNKNHCTASNEYFSEFCGVSIPTITRTVTKLKKLGYIETEIGDGRHRIIKMIRITNQIDESAPSKRLTNNIVNNKTNKTLSKDSVAQTNNFEFGSNKLYKPKKKTNDEEYLDSCLLITNFTSDINLQNKLKELFNNKKDICGQNGIHYFATTCKNYLEELSKVKDKLGAVNLSLEYNNTMKVMEPITKSSNGFVDNITASQKKSNLADKARDKNGNLITF